MQQPITSHKRLWVIVNRRPKMSKAFKRITRRTETMKKIDEDLKKLNGICRGC
jgi:hypothetical protein